MKKRGQFQLSFGMIFSIILIIVFLSFAFFVIVKFLSFGKKANIKIFVSDLQDSVDRLWKGTEGSQELKFNNLPKDIEMICFADFSKRANNFEDIYNNLNEFSGDNLFFYPPAKSEGEDSAKIKHIDIDKITERKNPYCLKNINGKIKLTIEKKSDEALVTIK